MVLSPIIFIVVSFALYRVEERIFSENWGSLLRNVSKKGSAAVSVSIVRRSMRTKSHVLSSGPGTGTNLFSRSSKLVLMTEAKLKRVF